MRGVRVTGPGQIEIADLSDPETEGLVCLRHLQVGICGTDTKIVRGEIPVSYPRVLGHELVAEVLTAAAGSDLIAGDRVLVDPGVSCGQCDMCRVGRSNICLEGGLLGRDVDGVFVERSGQPVDRLVRVPPSLGDREAGVLQVLGTCVHAMRGVAALPGQVAAVIGLGVGGQLISQLLRLKGYRVVGVTRSDWKRDLALRLGAIAVASPEAAAGVLADVSDGSGPTVVVEAVGTESTLGLAISLVATGGEIVAFGTVTGPGRGLPYYQLYLKELTVRNPRAAVMSDYADGIELAASGQVELEPLVTHVLDLDQADLAFTLVDDPSSLKVLMTV